MCEALDLYLTVLCGAFYYSCSAKLPMKHQFAVAEHLLFRQDGLLYSPNPARPFIGSRETLKQQRCIVFPFDQTLCGRKSFCRPLSEVLSALKGRCLNPIENQIQWAPNISRLSECSARCSKGPPLLPSDGAVSDLWWFFTRCLRFKPRLFHRANQQMSLLADLRFDRRCWLLQEAGPPEGTNWLWLIMATSHETSGR